MFLDWGGGGEGGALTAGGVGASAGGGGGGGAVFLGGYRVVGGLGTEAGALTGGGGLEYALPFELPRSDSTLLFAFWKHKDQTGSNERISVRWNYVYILKNQNMCILKYHIYSELIF